MFAAVDNIMIPIIWGIGISILMTLLLYFVSLVFEVQMSIKSILCSIVLFIAMLITSSSAVSGIYINKYISEAEDAVEEQISGGIEAISMKEMNAYIIQLHPQLHPILTTIEVNDGASISAAQYVDSLHNELLKYIFTRVTYFIGALIVFGSLSFLFAQRRLNYSSRKRLRRNGIGHARVRRIN